MIIQGDTFTLLLFTYLITTMIYMWIVLIVTRLYMSIFILGGKPVNHGNSYF